MSSVGESSSWNKPDMAERVDWPGGHPLRQVVVDRTGEYHDQGAAPSRRAPRVTVESSLPLRANVTQAYGPFLIPHRRHVRAPAALS